MDLNKIIHAIIAFLQALFKPSANPPGDQTGPKPEPVSRKVLLIVFDPPIPSENGRRLSDIRHWNSPQTLVSGYIGDLKEASYGYAGFEVVDTLLSDHFPLKEDGFAYDPDEFLRCLDSGSGFHQPDTADYHAIITDYNLVSRINSGEIDEVWMFGFPYSGFYESRMVGPGSIWCNAPPMLDVPGCNRRFLMMGFNYERGVGEMLESFSHRGEYILKYVYQNTPANNNLWQIFTRYEKANPGRAQVGTVHYAPNSQIDYDWGNPRQVLSGCRNWLNFPDLSGDPVLVDCSEWGGGDIRQHHLWWLRHFPHLPGSASGISSNWWQYVVDPNTVH